MYYDTGIYFLEEKIRKIHKHSLKYKILEEQSPWFSIKNPKNFFNIHRKTTVFEPLFNKVADLQPCNFIKKRLLHRCFPVNIAKFWNTYLEYLLKTTASEDKTENAK